MRKSSQVSSLGEDRQSRDGPDPWNAPQPLIILVAGNWHRVRSWRSTKRSMATASEFSSAGRPTEDCAVRSLSVKMRSLATLRPTKFQAFRTNSSLEIRVTLRGVGNSMSKFHNHSEREEE